MYAVTLYTTLHTVKELDITVKNAIKMGAIHKIIEIDVLKEAGIENNPKDRCVKNICFQRLRNMQNQLERMLL